MWDVPKGFFEVIFAFAILGLISVILVALSLLGWAIVSIIGG
jgi:hypothetical protein